MADCPAIDPTAPLQFVINAASGKSDADAKREVIETVLQSQGRRADLHVCTPAELPRVARELAKKALAARTAVVVAGGDGTLNTVVQAVHAEGCALGVVPLGTFNYFARTHGIPTDPAQAVQLLLQSMPVPVQVAGVNERVFLVNASLGLYPDLLEDRETFKTRFGRSRWVALWAALVTLLRGQRQLRLHIEQGASARDVRTLTLFVGNNRLQLEQVGVQPPHPPESGVAAGTITAVMLKPVGMLSMIGLMLRGAIGTLGEAHSVERFEFGRMVVRPAFPHRRRRVKVAFDGEVTVMRAPLDFHVLAKPLYLLRPPLGQVATDAGAHTEEQGG